jgi:hypothetical protein
MVNIAVVRTTLIFILKLFGAFLHLNAGGFFFIRYTDFALYYIATHLLICTGLRNKLRPPQQFFLVCIN